MGKKKIVAFGGSVMVGTSAKLDVMHDCFQYQTTTVNTVRETQTWRAILSRILSDWVDGGAQVINAGKDGDTAQKGLARTEREIRSASPDCVLLVFGAEDALAGTDAQAFGKTLEQMIDAVRKANARAVVVTPPPFSERMTAQRLGLEEVRGRQAALDGLAQAARGVSWKKSVPLVDLHAFFLGNRLAYDHLHEGWLPDAVAQSAMASFVAGELLGVLGAAGLPKVTLCDYRKAFSNPEENDWKHHAFTDLTFFEGSFYLTFREGAGHCPPPPPSGRIVVLRSLDAVTWDKEAVLETPNVEHSADPKFLAVDGHLFVYNPALRRKNAEGVPYTTFGYERLGPEQWDGPFECGPGVFWRPKKWRNQYVVAVYGTPNQDASLDLYASPDGRAWKPISSILPRESAGDETDLWIEDDKLVAYCRTGGGSNDELLIATYEPAENRWDTVSTGRIIEAPCVFRAGQRLMITGRYCSQTDQRFRALQEDWRKFTTNPAAGTASGLDPSQMGNVFEVDPANIEEYHHGLRTGIFVLDGTTPRLVMELLSAGDSSYPGVVQYGREYLISDYSMHEYYRPIRSPGDWWTPVDIYVSRIRFGE